MDALQAARAAYKEGRLHDALEAAQVACERRPKDPEAWRLLGAVSRHVRMPAAADDAFQRAARLSRSHRVPHRVSQEGFLELVEGARAALSPDAKRRLEKLKLEVRDLPDADLIRTGVLPDALSARLHDRDEKLLLFKDNHENRAGDARELARLVARSLQRA